MTVTSRKVCIIGDFAVGKTSVVTRFVQQVFSEKYLTTVGVKIDTREVSLDADRMIKLVLWDIAGGERFSPVEYAYLRGAAGYLLVADGTRPRTLEIAANLRAEIEARHGALPFVLLVNKSDLQNEWAVDDGALAGWREQGVEIFLTSALSGAGVDEAIFALAGQVAS